ncbi:unnamed protein product [Rhizoctonia solani]|uniref:Uncharacterized protein n=1 Tax=Rhizoctonia solani TaxID=456999 RepID=A0A8H3D5M3_9AGAM|nr:unnamed protein product [Rhizoctonia solani]
MARLPDSGVTPTLEFLIQPSSSNATPISWSLALFPYWITQTSELSEAAVRQVWCKRDKVHEFILLSCDVNTTTRAVTLWLRIERRPATTGLALEVLSNKAKPAEDTVMASINPQTLGIECDNRDSLMYDTNNNPQEVLKLKHIAEMYQYFTGHANQYVLFGSNCRWLCYLLFECLRECQLCYGGFSLSRSPQGKPTADIRTAQLAKAHYLRDKHPTCCWLRYTNPTQIGAHITKTTISFTSIGLGSSGDQNNRNRDSQYAMEAEYNQRYQTSRPPPESKIPPQSHELSTFITNGGGNVGTQQPPRTQSNMPPSDGSNPLSHNSSRQSHERDDTSLTVGLNTAQCPQPLTISEGAPDDVPGQSQTGQRTAPPPVNRATSQPSEAPPTSHCSNCQCKSHPSRTPKPTISAASAPHRCSIPHIQGGMSTQPPPSGPVSAPATPTAVHTSFSAAHPIHPERIHPNPVGRCGQFLTYPDATPRHNTVSPATEQLDCNCSSHGNSHIDDQTIPSPASHTLTADTGNDYFVSPAQCCPQPSFSGTGLSRTKSTAGYGRHNNRMSSSGSYDSSCDRRESMGTQGYHHTHNHPPHEQYHDPPYRVSHDYPSTHVYNNAPQSHQMHDAPPRPPTHQGIRVNPQGYHFSGQPRSHTNDPYATPRNHAHRTSLPPQRNSTNGNVFYRSQEHQAHPHAPSSSMGYGDNLAGEYHHSPRPNLSTIPENGPRLTSHNFWENLNETMATNPCCEHGAQPMILNHAYTGSQPPPSSSPAVTTFDHHHAHPFGDSFRGPYMANGVPATPYPTLQRPTKRWTEEVWGNQGPVRTESPSPHMHA